MNTTIKAKMISMEDILNAGCFNVGATIDVMEKALISYKKGKVNLPDKISQIFDEGTQDRINCMPATILDEKVCGVKWVSVFPGNPHLRNTPNVSGLIILSELVNGFPFAVMDGTFITALRTACMGAIGSKYLAHYHSKVIGIIGSGEQAKMHLITIKHVHPEIELCRVASRSVESEQRFIEEMQKRFPDMKFEACNADYDKASTGADIIVTAVSCQAPLLKAKTIKEGAYYCHVAGWESEQWDAVVRSLKEYDVYWLSGYVKAFQIHGDGEPLLFSFEGDNCRGINVVMKRDVAKDERFKGKIEEGRYFDFATPYGYGGWIVEGEQTEKLFEEYDRWIQKNGIISEFVRFHPMVKNHIHSTSFFEVIQLGEVVHIDLSSPEDIWNNIISKNRNMIRKAIKNGIRVYNGRFPEIYEKFRVIYNETMDKDDAEEYYYFGDEFYKSVLEDLPQNSQVFWAEKDSQVIAASIMIGANGYFNYHLSGSLREFSSLAPGNLILYTAALWGCANGYRSFYLGGGVGSGEDSLFKFKRAFYKGDLNHFYIGKKIYNQEKYNELLGLRAEIDNPGYFPKYRG